MNPDFMPFVTRAYGETHERVLGLVATLSEDELRHEAANGHSIAFELWHLARWADHLQAALATMTPELERLLAPRPQLWEAHGMAQAWGFTPEVLGFEQTGMLMGDEAAALLPLPDKATLLGYLRRAFAAAEQAVGAVDAQQFAAAERPAGDDPVAQSLQRQSQTVGGAILSHLAHENRHLGMIECMLGALGRPGTATR